MTAGSMRCAMRASSPDRSSPGSWTPASGEAGFEQLLALAPDLDGLFVANDQMALGRAADRERNEASRSRTHRRRRIRRTRRGGPFHPALTTVVQPLRELGELAVREVLSIANEADGRGTVRSLSLATQLIARESAPAITRAAATSTARTSARSSSRAAGSN